MIPNETIANELKEGFLKIEEMPKDKGGEKRKQKGQVWEKNSSKIITNIFERKQLNYRLYEKYKMKITDDLSIEVDKCITDNNDMPLYIIEDKDYTDSAMFRRFLCEAKCMISRHPNVKCISLSGQEASTERTRRELIRIIMGDQHAQSILTYTITSNKRDSRCPTQFITKKPDIDLTRYIVDLDTFLSGIIK